MIRRAKPEEAATISSLAIRSKAHWRYTEAQLAVFREELTLSPDEIESKHAHVFEEGEAITGFYTLMAVEDGAFELEHIFVEPDRLERGTGRALFLHACAVAAELGAKRLVIQSDPNAAGFYHALGAVLEREIPSSIPSRTIPYFTYELS